MSGITPTDISIALADLDKADYAGVLEFIRQAKGSKASTSTPEEKALRQQTDLVGDLKRLYSLTETARLAVLHINADETDAAVRVLLMVSNGLFELLDFQKLKVKQLAAIAYPEDEQGGANHE
ncbi:MAG: hypothetical protein R3E93_15900 [Thiothrix sp.]